jgi:hypothetical protein
MVTPSTPALSFDVPITTAIKLEISEPTNTVSVSKGVEFFCGAYKIQVSQVNLDGSITPLDTATETNLKLESQSLSLIHESEGSWNYSIRYTLQLYPLIAPVYHNFTVTTKSMCYETVLDELMIEPSLDLITVTLPG